MREQLMAGVDPARMAPAASVANVFARYRAEHLERRRSGAEIARVLDQELVGRFGALRLLDLRRRHIVEMHDEITRRGCPALANRALSYRVTFLSWCGAREIIDANPAAGIKRTIANRERPRERVLSDAELAAIWRSTFEATLPIWYTRVVRLLVLTGCRRSEIAGARWEWVRGDWLEVPGEHFKTGRAHQVHLTAMARADLPAPAGEAGAIFGRPTNWGRYKRALDQTCGVAGWTLHDLRRSVASGLQRLGERPEVIEAVLGHVIPGVGGIYVGTTSETSGARRSRPGARTLPR